MGEFIVEKQASTRMRGNLSGILAAVIRRPKVISRDINPGRSQFTRFWVMPAPGRYQGEQQKKLDVFAHKTISAAFFARDDVGFASEGAPSPSTARRTAMRSTSC